MGDRTAGLLTGVAAAALAYVGWQAVQPQPGAPGNPLSPAAPPVVKVMAFVSSDCQQCQRVKDNLSLIKTPPVKFDWVEVDRNRSLARRWKVRNPPVWILLDDREREDSRTEGHLSVPELFRWLRVPLPQELQQ